MEQKIIGMKFISTIESQDEELIEIIDKLKSSNESSKYLVVDLMGKISVISPLQILRLATKSDEDKIKSKIVKYKLIITNQRNMQILNESFDLETLKTDTLIKLKTEMINPKIHVLTINEFTGDYDKPLLFLDNLSMEWKKAEI